MATPNMSLDLPIVGTTIGPEYASMNNTAFETIDEHDHTSGKGVPVPVAGMNIDDDFPLNGNNLNSVRGLRLNEQVADLTDPGDNRIVYAKNGDLFYRNTSGQVVQITSGASVAGATGTITGLASPASAAYSSILGTFIFNKDSGKSAKIAVSDISISPFDVASAPSVTIKAPAALAGSYTMELPDAVPTEGSILAISPTGKLSPAFGQTPVGGVIAMFDNSALPGAFTLPISGAVSQGWMRADGAAVPAGQAITAATVLPNLSDSRFVMGSTSASLSAAGSNTKNLQHGHVMSHVHIMGRIYRTGIESFELYIRDTASVSATNITNSDVLSLNTRPNFSTDFSGNTAAFNYAVASGDNYALFTTGVRDAPMGADGAAAETANSLSASTDIRPNYLQAVYLIRVK